MYPTLAVVPQLPAAWLLPLLAVTVIAGLVLTVRGAQVKATAGGAHGVVAHSTDENAGTGLIGMLVACALLVIWSRNPIQLHSYGFFLVIGFSLAAWNASLEARRRGCDPNLVLDLALPLLAIAVVCCRLLYVALNPREFHSLWDVLQIWSGGLSFHGALIAAVLVVAYFARTRGIGFFQLADILAPSVFLGYAVGRVGCFFNGCCYGSPTSLPWAVRFPDEHNRAILTPPSHPAQLYSALMAICLFTVMQRAKRDERFNRFSGQLTLLFMAFYAVERAIMEVFRNGATALTMFGTDWLTQAQVTSICMLVGVAIFWAVLSHRATGLQLRAGQGPAASPGG